MRLSIDKRAFLGAVSIARRSADPKSSVIILGSILLAAESDGLRISATDHLVAYSTKLPADIKANGSVAISAERLHSIVSALPDGNIKIEVGDGERTSLMVGRTRFVAAGTHGDEFPELPDATGTKRVTVAASVLAELLSLSGASASDNPAEARPIDGVLLEGSPSALRATGTDGHRLTTAERAAHGEVFEAFVPSRSVGDLRKFADACSENIELSVSEKHLFATSGSASFITILSDEKFVPWKRVIPQAQSKTVIADRSLLLASVRRLRVVKNPNDGNLPGAALHFDAGELRVTRQAPDGELSDVVDVDYSGPPLSIGVCFTYLVDALSVLSSDEVEIGLNGDLDPLVLRPVGGVGETTTVIMPMRL